MGWRPRHVYECTVWEFWQAWDGWYILQTGKDSSQGVTHGELEAILRDYNPNG